MNDNPDASTPPLVDPLRDAIIDAIKDPLTDPINFNAAAYSANVWQASTGAAM